MSTGLADLFQHNLWANLRLLAACASVGDAALDASTPGTFGRVRDTLVHIFAVEEGYVAMVTGQAAEPGLYDLWLSGGFPAFDELRARARRSGEALIALASDLQPGQVLHVDSQGHRFTMAAIVPLIQAINHATEHRTHVVTILSQQGVAPPRIDGWGYAEELGTLRTE